MNAIAIAAHVLAAVVWVGGMFFAYALLRPTLAELEGSVRLAVWSGALKRFFPWVWLSIIVLFVSGFALVFNVWGGFAGVPGHVHIMLALAILMALLFFYLYYLPYRRFKVAMNAGNATDAAAAMNQVRVIVSVNLVLGIIVTLVASGGRYFSIL